MVWKEVLKVEVKCPPAPRCFALPPEITFVISGTRSRKCFAFHRAKRRHFISNRVCLTMKLPVFPHGASSHTENATHFPASRQRRLGAKLVLPISRFKNRKGISPCTPTKTLRHSSPPFQAGLSGAVFVKMFLQLCRVHATPLDNTPLEIIWY